MAKTVFKDKSGNVYVNNSTAEQEFVLEGIKSGIFSPSTIQYDSVTTTTKNGVTVNQSKGRTNAFPAGHRLEGKNGELFIDGERVPQEFLNGGFGAIIVANKTVAFGRNEIKFKHGRFYVNGHVFATPKLKRNNAVAPHTQTKKDDTITKCNIKIRGRGCVFIDSFGGYDSVKISGGKGNRITGSFNGDVNKDDEDDIN